MFVLLFIGGIPLIGTLAAMLVLQLSLAFVCALTPMLSPFDSVTVQTFVAILMLVYIGTIGVIL
jgi:energy-converting hydrogenase A subunit J